jgi:putative hydrolase of the HAD superfamily
MREKQTTEIKNIIFDLGGVLLNINPLLSLNEFAALSSNTPEELYKRLESEKIFEKFETGSINSDEFHAELCRIMKKTVDAVEINRAWNLMLMDFPIHRVTLLQQLKNNYRVYLLSNTNSIHYKHFTTEFYNAYRFHLNSLFDELFLSYEIGKHKPDPAIFKIVLENGGFDASECLFIDDSLLNVKAAEQFGIRCINITKDRDVTQYFENGKYLPE